MGCNLAPRPWVQVSRAGCWGHYLAITNNYELSSITCCSEQSVAAQCNVSLTPRIFPECSGRTVSENFPDSQRSPQGNLLPYCWIPSKEGPVFTPRLIAINSIAEYQSHWENVMMTMRLILTSKLTPSLIPLQNHCDNIMMRMWHQTLAPCQDCVTRRAGGRYCLTTDVTSQFLQPRDHQWPSAIIIKCLDVKCHKSLDTRC